MAERVFPSTHRLTIKDGTTELLALHPDKFNTRMSLTIDEANRHVDRLVRTLQVKQVLIIIAVNRSP